jgi:hypothetical protein
VRLAATRHRVVKHLDRVARVASLHEVLDDLLLLGVEILLTRASTDRHHTTKDHKRCFPEHASLLCVSCAEERTLDTEFGVGGQGDLPALSLTYVYTNVGGAAPV